MSLKNQTISFIGSGNMAEAIFAGLLRKEVVQPSQILAADINHDRLVHLAEKYGVRTTTSNWEAALDADVVILAVKPQYFATAAAGVRGHFKNHTLVLSIMAGITIETIEHSLEHPAIVRSIPNTPAMVGEGMTIWTAAEQVTDAQAQAAEAILTGCGQAAYVAEEKYLDMATAINGSGPGYVFLILEAMIDAGVQMGFTRPVAEQIVIQTVVGSALYARESGIHIAQLRNQVTSPGGTTAAGLFALEQGNLRATLAQGIMAAYKRSAELGK
ncbi:MAG: pyrroline-5-carboxylate reductase [Ardenticatenaceae bacterium]|nr:pyrroline-5-carboxylate reductase [Ardenticatenaceae bacterium]